MGLGFSSIIGGLQLWTKTFYILDSETVIDTQTNFKAQPFKNIAVVNSDGQTEGEVKEQLPF